MEIICKGETLILSHLRVSYWPRKKTVLLADMHLGKTGYFRQSGIQIPSTVMLDDLQRLSLIIDTYQPETIVIAGDMFHHDYNSDVELFKQWRQSFLSIRFQLVPGNHDKLLNINYRELDIEVKDKTYSIAPFVVTHKPADEVPGVCTISGHLHPGFTITGKAKQSVRMPCFIVSDRQIILPAFSAFTGLYTGHEISDFKKYYLVGNDEIFCI
ncbi:MAG: ligase-associated DNA damage response endonuclease PdeM [Niabella sp.]